jgi:hypothetical protein
MRRIAIIAAAIILTSGVDFRTTKAVPRYGIARYYYANACYATAYCRVYNPGSPGSLLGWRISGCSGNDNTISESDLNGFDYWKEEDVTDCVTGDTSIFWYHGGYQNWTAAASASCYYAQCSAERRRSASGIRA